MSYLTKEHNSAYISTWLKLLCLIIFVLFVVGAITRLTDAGLSITEWEPIMGIIPPLLHSDWQVVFEKYKLIPEYLLVNSEMTLDEFKYIYFWEWLHRFLARFAGLFLFIPFIIFLFLGKIRKATRNQLILLCLLFLLQAYMGWFMVQSGLVQRVDVSSYRLIIHLGLALIVLALCIHISLHPARLIVRKKSYAYGAFLLMCLVYIQILLGAFVAGTHAGKVYNTWPLINDVWIPDDMFKQVNSLEDFATDTLTIQFMHRVFAYIVLLYVIVYYALHSFLKKRYAKQTMLLILFVTFSQVILGILTLLNFSTFNFALMHHIVAIILFYIVIYHYNAVRNREGVI